MADEEFGQALDAVLRDLRAQCAVRPRLDEDAELGLMVHAPDGSGQGLVPPLGRTPAERLAHLAEQMQEWAVEALWSEGEPAVWPHCPDHPDTHPLEAAVVDGTAVWVCPRGGTRRTSRAAFARIGELGGMERGDGSRRR